MITYSSQLCRRFRIGQHLQKQPREILQRRAKILKRQQATIEESLLFLFYNGDDSPVVAFTIIIIIRMICILL